MKTIGAAQFKEKCLALLDEMDPEGLIITKHGRPVAKVIPISSEPNALIGALKTKLHIKGNILSTKVKWAAKDG